MGMILPLIIFVAFLGLNATTAARTKTLTPPPQQMAATVTGQNFVRYRDAVTNYATANPSFTGIAPWTSLSLYLNGGSATAFSNMNNVISIAYGGGRQVAVYTTSANGGSATALAQTNHDASIGRVVSGQWTSASSTAIGASAAIPDSGLVSLININ